MDTAIEGRVEIVRSSRRRRTASAGVRGDRLVVRVPAGLAPADERALVEGLTRRLAGRDVPPPVAGLPDHVVARPRGPLGPRGDRWLVAFADLVADRWLDGERATDVRWSTRMSTRWASCTPATGRIRMSTRLLDAPDAVVGNVLLHELAHLRERGHGPAFRALLDRDPTTPDVQRWLDRRDALRTRAALAAAGLTPEGD